MNQQDDIPSIFLISDGTGETVASLVQAVRVQFADAHLSLKRFNKVKTRENLDTILLSAQDQHATVIATIVNPELRVFLISRSMQLGVQVVDVLFPLLESFSSQLKQRPQFLPGLLRQLDESYFKRIHAIEYTVHHDDGLATAHDLNEADIILIGISRTSKTPLSMYLGHKGYKVANIPILPDVSLPTALLEIDQNKIIGLVIEPTQLEQIRKARVKSLGVEGTGNYTDIEKIFEELEWSRKLFSQHKKWPVLDVTGKALEEIAVEIEKIILNRFPKED